MLIDNICCNFIFIAIKQLDKKHFVSVTTASQQLFSHILKTPLLSLKIYFALVLLPATGCLPLIFVSFGTTSGTTTSPFQDCGRVLMLTRSDWVIYFILILMCSKFLMCCEYCCPWHHIHNMLHLNCQVHSWWQVL